MSNTRPALLQTKQVQQIQALPTNPVRAAARDAYRAAKGDRFQATKIMVDRVRNDPVLSAELLDPLILNACDAAIREVARGERDQIFATATANAGSAGSGEPVNAALALASGIRNTILNTPLRCGVRLRDATREQIQEEAEHYEAIARDAGQKARFYFAVARLIPPGKTVSQVHKLNEQYVARLFARAAHA